ncbi:MAG: hypothetical protein RIR79_1682 [Pseudomonadota bacterium]
MGQGRTVIAVIDHQRRRFLSFSLAASASASTSALLAGCDYAAGDSPTSHIVGGFSNNALFERGHANPANPANPANLSISPSVVRKTRVLIAGGGVAGLAAARSLRLQGIDDFALLDLQDNAGGNSQGTHIGGIACPQGAHYLPLPSDDAPEIQNLLEELGLRQRINGRWQYDERHLCHTPQERLFFNGHWQEGLLPVQGVEPRTLQQYTHFSRLVEHFRQTTRWTIPVQKSSLTPVHQALAAITFVAWLDREKLTDGYLRWYLDYCCRDDYGAGIGTVSAWAGIHYFASRHGFHAPSGMESVEREGLLTWNQGNAWLTERLAAPLGKRWYPHRVVLRIAHRKHHAEVDVFNPLEQRIERWQADRVIVALPIFVAARVVENPPDFLRHAARRTLYSPWLVANIHIAKALEDRPSDAPPSWDNVIYDPHSTQGLGYVDASHQNLHPVAGATVLTHYRALSDRRVLLQTPWTAWRDRIVAELSVPHPDVASKITQIHITRYGHAMAIPVPVSHSEPPIVPLPFERLRFAHSDWAGYSIFEEAFTMGHNAAQFTPPKRR